MSVKFGPEYVRALAPYQGGKPIAEVAREFGLDAAGIVKLASNENPLGMPASARAAMQEAVAEIGRYPDSNGFELKAAITAKHNVPADWITLGNGSNDILELAAHAFVQPGQSVIFSEYGFLVYALATQGLGARHIVVPAKDYGHDLPAMLNAIDGVTCIEPQGAFYAYPDLTGLLGRQIGGVTANSTLELADLVLDQARVAFVPGEAFGLAGYGRFSFALGDDDLVEGITRLTTLVS